MKSLVLRDWCLGFALLFGCAQDFVLLFLVAARLCVKRLVLRVWCLGLRFDVWALGFRVLCLGFGVLVLLFS